MTSKRIYFLSFYFLLLSACAPKKHHDNVFYWNMATGITSMDPAFARTQSNIWMDEQIFEGLVALDTNLKVIPALAMSWNINSDGSVYIFHLRQDVFFQNNACFPHKKGRRVIAADFVYSFRRLLNPMTASPGSWIFHGKVKPDPQRAFQALNDSTLRIELIKPFRPFLQLLTLKYASVIPQEAIEKYGKDFRSHPVGTGPFQLLFNDEGNKVILAKNPHYYLFDSAGRRLPYLDRVAISFVPSKQDEFFSFLKGQLSILSGVDASFKDELLEGTGSLKKKFKGKFQFQKIPFLNTEYVGFMDDSTLNHTPLIQKAVRQAIGYAINKKKLVRYLRNDIGTPGDQGFVPPALLPDTSIYYHYDENKAKALLASAGFRQLSGLRITTTEQYLDMAVFVQKELEKIGISVEIDNVPPASLSEMKAKGKALFFRGSWIADYADPENYFSVFYSKNFSPGGPNYFHYANASFDKLYEKALAEPNDSIRMNIYRRMEAILMEDAPAIPLFYDEVIRLVANNVKGLQKNAINLIDLKRVHFL